VPALGQISALDGHIVVLSDLPCTCGGDGTSCIAKLHSYYYNVWVHVKIGVVFSLDSTAHRKTFSRHAGCVNDKPFWDAISC